MEDKTYADAIARLEQEVESIKADILDHRSIDLPGFHDHQVMRLRAMQSAIALLNE